MAGELIDMAAQFRGLPMEQLIGSPLTAACNAQVHLASATADFIKAVGFLPPTGDDKTGVGDIRKVKFSYTRQVPDPQNPSVMKPQNTDLEVPLIAIVKVPNLSIKTVDITFDMEVKSHFASSESDDSKFGYSGDASVGWGPFSMHVHVEGSVSAHKEQTRSSDSSAKYHVEVRAEDSGIPEGLARVLEIMNRSITEPPVGPAAAADKT
jgi:hypothetical protein